MTKSQSHHIQILRGLAIIAVVFIHTTPGGMYQVFFRPFVNFCVGLFLFLSGMLSDAKKWSPVKRIFKVVVPYLIWTLLFVVMKNFATLSQIPILFVKHAITAQADGIMYYNFVYCQFALLIPLVDKLARSKMKYLGFVISPIEIIAIRYLPQFMGIELGFMASVVRDVSCLGWFTYFYLGYMLGNNLINVKLSTKTVAVLLAASIPLQMAEGYAWYWMGHQNSGSQMKITTVLTGALFVILAFRFVNGDCAYKCKPLAFLGDISFGIYFFHIVVIWHLSKFGINSFLPFPICTVVVLTVSAAFVALVGKLLGKYRKYLAF